MREVRKVVILNIDYKRQAVIGGCDDMCWQNTSFHLENATS